MWRVFLYIVFNEQSDHIVLKLYFHSNSTLNYQFNQATIMLNKRQLVTDSWTCCFTMTLLLYLLTTKTKECIMPLCYYGWFVPRRLVAMSSPRKHVQKVSSIKNGDCFHHLRKSTGRRLVTTRKRHRNSRRWHISTTTLTVTHWAHATF